MTKILFLGPENLSYFNFVQEGWMRIRNRSTFENARKIYAQKLLLDPIHSVNVSMIACYSL